MDEAELKWDYIDHKPPTWGMRAESEVYMLTWQLRNGRWVCEYNSQVVKVVDNLGEAREYLEELDRWHNRHVSFAE